MQIRKCKMKGKLQKTETDHFLIFAIFILNLPEWSEGYLGWCLDGGAITESIMETL
jgi:hypothetical protein